MGSGVPISSVAKEDDGHLYEQIDKKTGRQYNAKDLTWSYAEVPNYTIPYRNRLYYTIYYTMDHIPYTIYHIPYTILYYTIL